MCADETTSLQSVPRDQIECWCRVSVLSSREQQLHFMSLGHWAGRKIIADSETIKECIPAATDAVLKGKTKAKVHNEFKKISLSNMSFV